MSKYTEFGFRLADGVSTLEDGFLVGFPVGKDDNYPISCILVNKAGDLFAIFRTNKTIGKAKDCSRAELEAIEGTKKLILKWE